MKVYYKDNDLWIVSSTEKSLLGIAWSIGAQNRTKYAQYRDTYSVKSVYIRETPIMFLALKERSPFNSIFLDIMKRHNIHMTYESTNYIRFVETRDQFLFDLKFGNYE